jgi:hypothetical protein
VSGGTCSGGRFPATRDSSAMNVSISRRVVAGFMNTAFSPGSLWNRPLSS